MIFSKCFLVCLYFIILSFIGANTTLPHSDLNDELFHSKSWNDKKPIILDHPNYGDINEKDIPILFNRLKHEIDEVLGRLKYKELEWWQKGIIYQIYPRSFKDSTGNGVGDIRGVIEKIPYLKELGIDIAWLNPIYPSSGFDGGYDIIDFKNIDESLGSMKDFDDLKEELHRNGIKIILDFVPNHTSDEHEWFVKSVQKIEPYTDYYVWADAKYVNNTRQEPNNWNSVMGGSMWEWNEKRQQYYLHQFFKQQPDLNYWNPLVQEAVKDIFRFWLDKGVDGFRMDAVSRLYERKDLLDAPGDAMYQQWDGYITCLDETFEEVQAWRVVLDEYNNKNGGSKLMVIETYEAMEHSVKFYGNLTHPGAHFPLNLFLGFIAHEPASSYVNTLSKWLSIIPPTAWPSWEIGNHDMLPRPAARFGEELIDGIHMIQMLLPGTPVIYMADELGMSDTYLRYDQLIDNWSKKFGYSVARERNRTPFPWDATAQAGFSTNKTTWIPVNPNYVTLNVEYERTATRSHLKIFKDLVNLRQLEIFRSGDVQFYEISEYVFAFSRSKRVFKSHIHDIYFIVVNLGNEMENINLLKFNDKLIPKMIVNIASMNAEQYAGDIIDANSFNLRPNGALVLESIF